MARKRPAAELLFEEYLDAHAYGWEHEPDLNIDTAPDYRIRRAGVEVICEVKEFETQAIRALGQAAGGPVVVPPKLLYRTIRAQLDSAARQLRPLAGRGLPLLVVLANPSGATVSLDPPALFHAMYGGGGLAAPGGDWAAPGATMPSIEQWPLPTAAGRDGALTAKHDYISAVVALRDRRDPAAPFDAPPQPGSRQPPYVHVVESLSHAAIPVPANVFDGMSDARWSPDADNRYCQVAGALRAGSVRDREANRINMRS